MKEGLGVVSSAVKAKPSAWFSVEVSAPPKSVVVSTGEGDLTIARSLRPEQAKSLNLQLCDFALPSLVQSLRIAFFLNVCHHLSNELILIKGDGFSLLDECRIRRLGWCGEVV